MIENKVSYLKKLKLIRVPYINPKEKPKQDLVLKIDEKDIISFNNKPIEILQALL